MAQAISNLPVGAKVKFGKYSVNGETAQSITWLIVAKNHSGYPSNSCTLLTEKIIDLRAIDAPEPKSLQYLQQNAGNNRYSLSNIDQWLNKSNPGGEWYVAAHERDQDPSDNSVLGGTAYTHRPAFLNAFTNDELSKILTTTLTVGMPSSYGFGYESISRKVFLPSQVEVGLRDTAPVEGSRWEYFANGSYYAYLTQQAFTNTLYTRKPDSISNPVTWGLRTPEVETITSYKSVPETTYGTQTVWGGDGGTGIRPAMNVSTSLKVTDTTDSEGCYVVTWNSAPNKPSTISVPTIYGGKATSISWGKVTDPDGDVVTYTLECSVNGGSYTQIYKGTALTYAHLVNFGTTNVTYRVKATDPTGDSSAYTTSATVTVINNYAPVISGSDSNLGVKSSGFTGTYTVTDANNNAVTVTESIDGVQIRSLVATLGAAITYGITGDTWLTLPNGSHTLTIRATDGIDSSVRNITFTKLVDSFTIEKSMPLQSTNMPTRIMMVVTRVIPSTATFKVEVCNNGYDASPTWENATDAVQSGLVHVFTNKSKTATQWGVNFRVTVERNGATGACYVSAIGGNFE